MTVERSRDVGIDAQPHAGEADAPPVLLDALDGDRHVERRCRARCTRYVSVSPGCAFVSAATSLGERIGLPSTATMRSPLASPARSAGLPGST